MRLRLAHICNQRAREECKPLDAQGCAAFPLLLNVVGAAQMVRATSLPAVASEVAACREQNLHQRGVQNNCLDATGRAYLFLEKITRVSQSREARQLGQVAADLLGVTPLPRLGRASNHCFRHFACARIVQFGQQSAAAG